MIGWLIACWVAQKDCTYLITVDGLVVSAILVA